MAQDPSRPTGGGAYKFPLFVFFLSILLQGVNFQRFQALQESLMCDSRVVELFSVRGGDCPRATASWSVASRTRY